MEENGDKHLPKSMLSFIFDIPQPKYIEFSVTKDERK